MNMHAWEIDWCFLLTVYYDTIQTLEIYLQRERWLNLLSSIYVCIYLSIYLCIYQFNVYMQIHSIFLPPKKRLHISQQIQQAYN